MTTFDPAGDLELQLSQMLNKGLLVQDNFNWGIVETALVAGENEIQHGLGFVPNGYIIIYHEDETVTSEDDLPQNINLFVRGTANFFTGLLSSTSTVVIGAEISGSSIELWTTEILFLTSSVANPRVRLFVL